jgi:hypothetical protein
MKLIKLIQDAAYNYRYAMGCKKYINQSEVSKNEYFFHLYLFDCNIKDIKTLFRFKRKSNGSQLPF